MSAADLQNEALEKLMTEVDILLADISFATLKIIAENLNVEVVAEGISRRILLRQVQNCIDKCVDATILSTILEDIKKLVKPTAVKDAEKVNVDGKEDVVEEEKKEDMGINGGGKENVEKDTGITIPLQTVGNNNRGVTLMREFKIHGSIGNPGQKEKLTYISLQRQIQEGITAGHAERVVINAVLRAISPGLHLRSVLEYTPDLNLAKLQKYLQSHYVERNATDLCQSLTSITQSSQESAVQFLYRAMELRQRVLLSSGSPGSSVKYDKVLVQQIFLKTIETGLSSEVVLNDVKSLLRDNKISDEDLIFKISQAANSDIERSAKQNLKSKSNRSIPSGSGSGSVSFISGKFGSGMTDNSGSEKSGNSGSGSGNSGSDNSMMTLLKEMQSEMRNVRSEINLIKNARTPNKRDNLNNPNNYHDRYSNQENNHNRPHSVNNYSKQPFSNSHGSESIPHYPANSPNRYQNNQDYRGNVRKQPRKCYSCWQKKLDRCPHCFHCGDINHMARDCTNPKNQ